jgi:hypothetical protein
MKRYPRNRSRFQILVSRFVFTFGTEFDRSMIGNL